MYVRQIEVNPRQQGNRYAKGSSGMESQEGQNAVGTMVRQVPEIRLGSFWLKAELDEDEEFKEKAIKELRETSEVTKKALEDIRVLVKGEPNLQLPDDDEFYMKFLRPCKWYPKSAFELMKRFYQYKLNHSRYCDNLVPSNEKKTLSSEILIPLPGRTQDGCRLLLINAGRKWNTKIITLDEIYRSVMLTLDAAMAEPKTQIAGVHVILNMEGLTLTHVTHITPSFAATLADWVQRCLPCRLKGIHIVNQPFIFNMVFAIFKPFLLEKTRKRLHFHGTDWKSLASHVGTKTLPTYFGGELSMPDVAIGNDICEYFCWFEKEFEASNKCGYIKTAKR